MVVVRLVVVDGGSGEVGELGWWWWTVGVVRLVVVDGGSGEDGGSGRWEWIMRERERERCKRERVGFPNFRI